MLCPICLGSSADVWCRWSKRSYPLGGLHFSHFVNDKIQYSVTKLCLRNNCSVCWLSWITVNWTRWINLSLWLQERAEDILPFTLDMSTFSTLQVTTVVTDLLATVLPERVINRTNISSVSTAGCVGEFSGHSSHRSDILPFCWPATHYFKQHGTCPCLWTASL